MPTTLDAPADAPGDPDGELDDVLAARSVPAIWFPVAAFLVWRIASAIITTLVFDNGFRDAGLRWDSGNYITLTRQGYYDAADFQPVTAFFPFVAWCAKALAVVVRDEFWAFMIVANAAALGAFVGVWGAVREWRSETVARWAVVLLALFPAGFFLWSFYSEAAFIGLSAGAVWAASRDKPWIAAALLAATASTRTIGILVAAVLVVGQLWRVRRVDKKVLLYAAGGALGLALVMTQMWYQMGDPLGFLSVQEDWGREVVPPWTTVENGWLSIPDSQIFPEQPITQYKAKVLDFVSVWVIFAAAAWMAWPRRDVERRWPTEAWLLVITLALLPLSSRLLYSFNRFAIADWPIFAAFAEMIVLSVRRWKLAWIPVAALVGYLAVMSYQFMGHWIRYNFLG